MTKTKTDEQLRRQAVTLREKGKDSLDVAQKLKVPRGTVSAWFAHHTRGTYDDE